jgi:hypothetical protein
MISIHKAAALVIALAITFSGATLVTAPLALAGSQSAASHRPSTLKALVASNTYVAPVGIADRL